MEQQKKTVKEIREIFVNLSHKEDDGYHYIGFKEKNGFNIQGTGATAEEAWDDAYQWRTKTGRYDPEANEWPMHRKSEDMACDPGGLVIKKEVGDV